MAPTPHILYAHREDEITSLLDAIDAQDAPEVLLVVPREALLFRDLLNLKLLKRECEKLNKKLTISTQDPSGVGLAKKAGIAVEVISEGEKFFEEWPTQRGSGKGGSLVSQPSEVPQIVKGQQIPISVNSSPSMTTKPSPDQFNSYVQKPSLDLSRRGGRGRAMDVMPSTRATDAAPRRSVQMPSAPLAHGASEEKPIKEEIYQEESSGRTPRRIGKKFFIWTLSVLLVLGILGAGIRYIKPSATVTIYPKEDAVEFEMDLSGRTEISSVDIAKAVLPLERFLVEETTAKEFPSSGDREVVSKAHGKLTVYNAFSSSPQPIVATTRFLSESGKLFRTPKAVVIPGAKVEGGKLTPGSIEIEVVADQAGAEYNIAPSRFSIPGFSGTPKDGKFYGESHESLTGGFKGSGRVVEKKDIEAARSSLISGESDRMKEVLRKKFPPDLVYSEGALLVASTEVSVSPKEGEPGEKFTLTVHTIAQAYLFREQDVLAIVEPNITENLGGKYRTLPDTRKISYTVRQLDAALGRLALTALISVRRQAVIDEGDLRLRLINSDIDQAKAFFAEQNHIDRVNLSLWPFWSRQLPADSSRIKVITGKK